jgi:hypothetical protein
VDDRILLIPPDWAPDPTVFETWPMARATIEKLQAFLPTDYFRWPSLAGEPAEGDPIECILHAFSRQLRPEHHVVAIVSREVVLQAFAERPPRSLVNGAFVPSPATAMKLGEDDLARALAAQNTLSANVAQIARMVMQGAIESEIEKTIADLKRTCDFGFVARVREAVETQAPEAVAMLNVPTLYLSPAVPINPGDDKLFEMFQAWFPNARRGRLQEWGLRLHDPAGGAELADIAVPFIQEVIARRETTAQT